MITPRGRTLYRAAEALVSALAPYCERIEIAGSIRRRKPEPSDIEIVAISKTVSWEAPGDQAILFGVAPAKPDHLAVWYALDSLGNERDAQERARILPLKPGTRELIMDPNWEKKQTTETRYLRLHLPKVDAIVDLFLTRPDAWGAIFAIRTGPASFSSTMVQRFTKLTGGGHFTDGRLVLKDGTAIETPEESDVFRACRMKHLEPFDRIDENSVLPDDPA